MPLLAALAFTLGTRAGPHRTFAAYNENIDDDKDAYEISSQSKLQLPRYKELKKFNAKKHLKKRKFLSNLTLTVGARVGYR